jgi:hypothetical protein
LGDAGELKNETGEGWQIISISRRFRSLSEKFNALAGLAQGDILVVWEDWEQLVIRVQNQLLNGHNAG